MIQIILNHHRGQRGNYHAQGLVLMVTDDYGNAVPVSYPQAWQHPETQSC